MATKQQAENYIINISTPKKQLNYCQVSTIGLKSKHKSYVSLIIYLPKSGKPFARRKRVFFLFEVDMLLFPLVSLLVSVITLFLHWQKTRENPL